MMEFWLSMPSWVQYLIQGITLCAMMCCGAVILSRAGRNPYWAVLAIIPIPWILPILVCVFAVTKWPNLSQKQ